MRPVSNALRGPVKLLALPFLAVALVTAAAATARGPKPLVRDCSTAIWIDPPNRLPEPGPGTVTIGPITFGSYADPAAVARLRDGDHYSLKTPLSVGAGRPVTLTVRRRDRARLSLVYAPGGGVFRRSASVRFIPCPRRSGWFGSVTGFNGDFRITRPGCYGLVALVRGRRYARTVSFGAGRCG
jgi:hypothetical protein